MSVDDDQPEVLFRAKLQRDSGDIPWGFRLQGGVEFDTPLTVLKVMADSVASRCGLNAGDIVVRLCGQAASVMTHLMAQQAIANSGNTLEIIVQRAEVTLPSQQVVPDSLANNNGMLPTENYQVLNNGSIMTMDTISQTMPNTNSSVVSRQPSGMRSTSASVELIRDVSIIADDVILNHNQRNDDDQNPRNTRQYVQQPRQRSAGDVISGQQGHSLVSRHSNIPATRNDEMTSSRIRQPTSGSREKRVHGGGSVGTVFCSSRTDDDDEIERQFDRIDVTTITEKQHFNIPVTSFGDRQMKHLHPVEALVSTDAVSRDYPGFGSIADSSSDSVSDCASEISDDVASVIEMPITSATSGDGNPRDGGRFGKDGACDDTESGISPDYDSFDDCSFLPAQQADGVGYFRPVFSPKSDSERGRSPTPTPDDNTSQTTASSTTPTPVTSGCNDQSNSAVRNENKNGGTIADSVFGNRINFNAQDQRGDGGTRRDFSQTAPWRVSGSQQRSAMSLLSAVGTSISDPDIVSSSASADRIATSKLMVINRRPCSRRSPASEAQAQPPGDSNKAQLESSGGQEPNVVHIPISYGSTSSSPTVGTRVAATVSIVPVTDRPSSQAAIPPTNSGSKSSVREPVNVTVTAAAANIANPRCYIPQKPPPIPMPASVGPEPRSSLRTVRSTNSTSSESKESDQPQLSKPCPPVATRRWTDDETDRRVRHRDDTKVSDYVDEQADLPKRPVREMVAELNNRLERCERTAVDGFEAGSPLDSPYGSRYDLREAEAARGRRRSSSGSGSDSEREIIIDTPPASMTNRFSDDDQSVLGFSQRTLVDSKSDASQLTSSVNKRRPVIITPTVSYHGTIVYSTPSDILQQLSPRSARRFSLPTSSASSSSSSVASFIHPQRKVRFAEPPESSVIEIESSRRRRPAASGGAASPDVIDGEARPPLAADWRRTRQRSWISARHQQQPHQQPLVRSADEDDDVDRDAPNVWNEARQDSPSTDDVEYGSVTSLSEKLDRIELEHALASAAMRRSRPYQQQPQQQQQQPRHQTSSDPSTIVGATNLHTGDGGRPHQQRQASASGKLEPINERIISIQQPMPTDYSAFYDDNDNVVGGSAGPTPIVGGLRYLFRRRSNADVTRLMSQRGDASSGGGFSVSIGPSTSGGGRLSLLVQQTSPGTRVNLVFPSSTSVGHSFARGSDGGERVTYSIASTSPSSSGSGNRSMPPTYEESVRGTAVPSPGQHHHHHRHHQRSPSAQDFSPAAAGVFPGVIRHQQQQLVVPSMPPNIGQSSPTAQAGYSQTLQVDTGLRQYQPSPTSSLSPSLSPRHSTPQSDPSTPVFVGQPSGLNRSPIPLGRHLAERQARLELARSRPHSGDLDLTTPGASGQQFNTGRCSSPLILSPTGPPGRQLIPATLSAIMPDRPWPGSHRLTSPPEIVNHQNASPITFLPVSPQTALTSPLESMPPNYSGVLAFLDKTFTDKILSWQAQRSRDGVDGTDGGQLQQSETYKLVREMDEQQYRRSDHF